MKASIMGWFRACSIIDTFANESMCSVETELEFPVNRFSDISINRFVMKDPELNR